MFAVYMAKKWTFATPRADAEGDASYALRMPHARLTREPLLMACRPAGEAPGSLAHLRRGGHLSAAVPHTSESTPFKVQKR